MTRIGYLVHDLSDPAVARRLSMLHAGGATVATAGLLREGRPIPELERLPGEPAPISLGHSADARLAQRALLIAGIAARQMGKLRNHMAGAEVLIARNLEMLAVAARLAGKMTPRPRLVYECLDIHRLLTAPGAAGKTMRAVEHRLGRSVDLVLTSSPAFVTHHLGPAGFGNRVHLVENKVLSLPGSLPPQPATPPGPPWRIGWFGALRCRRTFELLSSIARQGAGQVEISVRGRPSEAIFADLSAEAAAVPYLSFGGAYDYARDLGDIYGGVHFAWCIDFYEQGANSSWLLPNRLYESVFHNTVPIALNEVETGAVLRRAQIGITVDQPDPADIVARLASITPDAYEALLTRQRTLPKDMWSTSIDQCRELVAALRGKVAA